MESGTPATRSGRADFAPGPRAADISGGPQPPESKSLFRYVLTNMYIIMSLKEHFLQTALVFLQEP
jgi:hypothetical protein